MVEYALLCANLSMKSPTTYNHSKECHEWYVNYDQGIKVPDENSVATEGGGFVIFQFNILRSGEESICMDL